ncbi:hypothetical protein FRB99_003335 [Tulasnella sp. 403]|nr:hypothetical protein FRB99_003335 [Tulasnella sp. 403]
MCDIRIGTRNQGGGAVAVKTLRGPLDETLARYTKAQAALWQRLDHPNILPFIGLAEDDESRLYLLSPWMENGSLCDYLRRNVEADRPQLLLHTASALVYLHGEGIIHGDIKGSNILVSSDPEPRAMLCGFRLSRHVHNSTLPGLKGAGTVRWQAPELWDNKPKSYQTDSYSFGMTIYEILSGKEPFHDCNNHAGLLARLRAGTRPPKDPKTSPYSGESWGYLWDVAERCWKANPRGRPDMETVCHWLQTKEVEDEDGSDEDDPPAETSIDADPPKRIQYPRSPGISFDLTTPPGLASRGGPAHHFEQNLIAVRLHATIEESVRKGPNTGIVEFRTSQPISNGALGGLFQAYLQASQERTVALRQCKVLIPRLNSDRRKIIGEMGSAWTELDPDHIVPFWGFGTDDRGFLYFAWPWARDGSLADYVQAHPDADRVKYLQEAAAALRYLHGQKPPIFHGNIKAQNILVWGDHASLCDLIPPTITAFGLTRAPRVAHPAPEATLASSPTVESDVFAFGFTIYEASG